VEHERPYVSGALASGQAVRLGVVRVDPMEGGPGREIAVWLECLDAGLSAPEDGG